MGLGSKHLDNSHLLISVTTDFMQDAVRRRLSSGHQVALTRSKRHMLLFIEWAMLEVPELRRRISPMMTMEAADGAEGSPEYKGP